MTLVDLNYIRTNFDVDSYELTDDLLNNRIALVQDEFEGHTHVKMATTTETLRLRAKRNSVELYVPRGFVTAVNSVELHGEAQDVSNYYYDDQLLSLVRDDGKVWPWSYNNRSFITINIDHGIDGANTPDIKDAAAIWVIEETAKAVSHAGGNALQSVSEAGTLNISMQGRKRGAYTGYPRVDSVLKRYRRDFV